MYLSNFKDTIRIDIGFRFSIWKTAALCIDSIIKSMYKFSLAVLVFVCLFISDKGQNGWTDRAQILCVTSRDPRECIWMIKVLKICVLKFFIFVKFWKCAKNTMKSANFFFGFCFILYKRRCSQIKPQLKVEIEVGFFEGTSVSMKILYIH